ncbi:hypothetical protein COCOBI_07-1450 [Coccomyxa sp. Obi]|nr:hypothetical protein COCOBI_07-1450 [Coccomyxa sp. Obi]
MPLARVDKLRIKGRNLDLSLPAGVSWDTVEVDAIGNLELRFEDLKGFPLAVPRFAARFSLLGSIQALELCTGLGRSGIECAFQSEEQSRPMFWYPAETCPFQCWCGACLDCLVASGQAVEHLEEPDMHRNDDILHDDGFGGLVMEIEEEGESTDEDEEEDEEEEDEE